MSWEEMASQKHKCPCGLGTYTIRSFMDDWNRFEDSWEMDCIECKQNYGLYTYHYQDSGMTAEAHLWVPRESYEEVKAIEKQLTKVKEEVFSFAESCYMDSWLSYFQDAKTKKEIWRRLTDNGERYPSLSTFYSHNRGQSPAEYLRKEFRYDSLPVILMKLGIVNDEVNERLRMAKTLEDDFLKAHERLRREGYR